MTINLSIYADPDDVQEMLDAIESVVDAYDGNIKGLAIKKGLFDEER